jgi:hypothetical protein
MLLGDGADADVNVDGNTVFVKWSAKTNKINYTDSADSFFLKEYSEGTAKIAYYFQHVKYSIQRQHLQTT